MKIQVNQIPAQGLLVEKEEPCLDYDLDTELIKFRHPIFIRAQIVRITNAITVELSLSLKGNVSCARCLCEFEADFDRSLTLHYQVQNQDEVIDLIPDIREEIILGYPMKFLCHPLCRGLCPKCGKNLNEGDCGCS